MFNKLSCKMYFLREVTPFLKSYHNMKYSSLKLSLTAHCPLTIPFVLTCGYETLHSVYAWRSGQLINTAKSNGLQ